MFGHTPRAKNPFEQEIHTRHLAPIDVKDIETAPMKYVALALVQLREELKRIPVMLADRSRRVDEYNVQSMTAESLTQVIVQPQFESGEIIESILVTGPTGGTASLQLGDRFWNLALTSGIAGAGFMIISPIAIMLSRNDNRILTPASAGEWSLELMGYADTRGNII